MSLETIWLPPIDEQSSAVFAFSHMDEHVKIANAIFAKYGVNVQLYPLDPMPPLDNRGLWGNQHQAMHNDADAVLGLASGPDLTSLDWNNHEEVAVWSQLHVPRHLLYAQTLGLT